MTKRILAALSLILCLTAAPASAFSVDFTPGKNFKFTLLLAEGPLVIGISALRLGGEHCSRWNRVTEPIVGGGFPNPLVLSRLFMDCLPKDGES